MQTEAKYTQIYQLSYYPPPKTYNCNMSILFICIGAGVPNQRRSICTYKKFTIITKFTFSS